MKKISLLSLILMLGLVVVACTPKEQQEVANTSTDTSQEEAGEMHDDDAMMDGEGTSMGMPAPGVDPDSVDEMVVHDNVMMSDGYQANLLDVSGGSASGIAIASFNDDYRLTANFENLPEPTGTDFYEGWVVRKNPLDVISTGKANKINGKYVNNYSSSADLIDHDFYVLTIEPDDGNPAPADHILEGTLTKK